MNEYPFVTVVMPVRNEGSFIERSLGAVFLQDYPSDRMEVLVADGLSTDGTRERIIEFQKAHPNLQMVSNPDGIVPTGMNRAIRQARGEIIVRVDGHCEIDREYVRRAVERLQRDKVDGVGGPIDTIGETPLAEAIATAMSSAFGVGGSAFRTVKDKTMLVDTVAFPAYTRAIIERAGPYDEELVRNQDDEYNYRLRKLGAKVLLASDVKARYYSRSSIPSLWRQYYQYGYWKVRVMQKHTLQMRPRQFAPLVLVVSMMISLVAAPFHLLGLASLLAVSGSYLLANLAASALTASRQVRMSWMLPVIFATLHFAYGFGFLKGLIKFRNRWGDQQTRLLHSQAEA